MRALFILTFAVGVACAAPALGQAPPRCGDPHARPDAANAVALCERELAAATNATTDEQARLLYALAIAQTNLRDLPAAIATLDRLIARAPSHARAHRLRGYVYWRQRDFAPALRDTQEALRLDPALAQAHYSLALIHSFREGGVAEAIDAVSRAHALEPQNPVFLTSRCEIRHAAGQFDLALADCNAALALRPRHADTLEYRGRVHMSAGRFAEARADFEAALSLEDALTPALYGRGLARVALGETQAGQADMARAIAADSAVAKLFVAPRTMVY